jgi:hypothetical protein
MSRFLLLATVLAAPFGDQEGTFVDLTDDLLSRPAADVLAEQETFLKDIEKQVAVLQQTSAASAAGGKSPFHGPLLRGENGEECPPLWKKHKCLPDEDCNMDMLAVTSDQWTMKPVLLDAWPSYDFTESVFHFSGVMFPLNHLPRRCDGKDFFTKEDLQFRCMYASGESVAALPVLQTRDDCNVNYAVHCPVPAAEQAELASGKNIDCGISRTHSNGTVYEYGTIALCPNK